MYPNTSSNLVLFDFENKYDPLLGEVIHQWPQTTEIYGFTNQQCIEEDHLHLLIVVQFKFS